MAGYRAHLEGARTRKQPTSAAFDEIISKRERERERERGREKCRKNREKIKR